jgi:hypothetical protein
MSSFFETFALLPQSSLPGDRTRGFSTHPKRIKAAKLTNLLVVNTG